MQLKLLNIHKLLSNIATNLVGSFIPVIVYEATGSLTLSILFFAIQYLVRIAFVEIFKKPFQTKPQVMLVVRILPILLYSMFVILIEYNVWVGVIGVIFFSGLSNAFKSMPTEIIFNYSSLSDGSEGSLGFTRLIEQIGVFVSFLVGGYLLEISKIMTVIISIVIYAISVVPLVIYYLKCKQDKTFNKDAISNATLTFSKDNDKYTYGKVLSKKLVLIYGITYFVYCLLDAFASLFNIHLFVIYGSYAIAGILNAVYNAAYGIGNFVYGKIAEKRDIQVDVIISCIVCALCVVVVSFVNVAWVQYTLFAILGFAYAPICLFNLERLLAKSRILGNSNKALFVREQSSNGSVVFACLPGLFGSILPCFIVIAVSMLASSVLIPYHEEKSRRLLVDYLQYNEIKIKTKIRPFK